MEIGFSTGVNRSLRSMTIGELVSYEKDASYRRTEKRERKSRSVKKVQPMGTGPGIPWYDELERRRIQIPEDSNGISLVVSVKDATDQQFRRYVIAIINTIRIYKKKGKGEGGKEDIFDEKETEKIRYAALYQFLGYGEYRKLGDSHIETILRSHRPLSMFNDINSKWYVLDDLWRVARIHPDSLFV